MTDSSFMLDAKCRNMDPELFDSGHPAEAALLCAGCPVIPECAEWHMQPISIGDYMWRLSGRTVEDAGMVWVSGVKAAGVNLG